MQKIMIVHEVGDLNVNVNLTGLVTILCEHGFQVDYYCPWKNLVPPHPGVRIVPAEGGKLRMIDTYNLVVGIDHGGIILAAQIARDFNIPYGLISYEIFFTAETGAEFKQPEIDACAGISFAVCQGGERSQWLAKENRIDAAKIIEIPVAGRGVQPGPRNSFLHEALSLPANLKIALYIGSVLQSWSMVDELIESTQDWDDSWLLVLHSRTESPAAMRALKQRHGDASRYRISPQAGLPLDGLQALVKSADLGLAFYRPTFRDKYSGLNLKYMGLSSAKIATYLQHGVPIAVNDIGEMSDAVNRYRLGIRVQTLPELAGFLRGANRDALEARRRDCYEFFSEILDLNVRVRPLLEVIKSCAV